MSVSDFLLFVDRHLPCILGGLIFVRLLRRVTRALRRLLASFNCSLIGVDLLIFLEFTLFSLLIDFVELVVLTVDVVDDRVEFLELFQVLDEELAVLIVQAGGQPAQR